MNGTDFFLKNQKFYFGYAYHTTKNVERQFGRQVWGNDLGFS